MQENGNDISIEQQGLIDDGIYGYQMKSPYAYLRYGYDPNTKIFYLYNIGTPKEKDRNKGYSKILLEKFFQIISQHSGSLDEGNYTTSGMAYVKHVVERLSTQCNVRLVKGREI